MRKLLFLLVFTLTAQAAQAFDFASLTNQALQDQAHLFPRADRDAITQDMDQFYVETGVRFYALTIRDFPSAQFGTHHSLFAQSALRQIHSQRDDPAILLVVAQDIASAQIVQTGAVPATFDGAIARALKDTITPELRRSRWPEATRQGIAQIIAQITGPSEPAAPAPPQTQPKPIEDRANMLGPDTAAQILDQIRQVRQATGVSLGLVTQETTQPPQDLAAILTQEADRRTQRTDIFGLQIVLVVQPEPAQALLHLGPGYSQLRQTQADRILNEINILLENGATQAALSTGITNLIALVIEPEYAASVAQISDGPDPNKPDTGKPNQPPVPLPADTPNPDKQPDDAPNKGWGQDNAPIPIPPVVLWIIAGFLSILMAISLIRTAIKTPGPLLRNLMIRFENCPRCRLSELEFDPTATGGTPQKRCRHCNWSQAVHGMG